MVFDRYSQSSESRSTVVYDEGLRKYMLQIYNYMAGALGLTGVFAYLAASTPALYNLLYNVGANGHTGLSGFGIVVAFAPLGIVIFLHRGMASYKVSTLQMLFWLYAAVFGLSLSSVFLAYTAHSVARVFFITASVFGAMSLYGYTTKKDLTSMGNFMFIGLIGIVIASLVNLFMQSTALMFALSVLSVVVFVGLTAHDTQKLKENYDMVAYSPEGVAKASIMGALTLYMDFINLFLAMIRLFGERRD